MTREQLFKLHEEMSAKSLELMRGTKQNRVIDQVEASVLDPRMKTKRKFQLTCLCLHCGRVIQGNAWIRIAMRKAFCANCDTPENRRLLKELMG